MISLKRNAGYSPADFWPRLGFLVALVVGIATTSVPCGAWSEGGHIAIAELAIRELSVSERDLLNGIAQALVVQNRESARLVERYGPQSAMALTAAWTDGIRGRTLEDIFEQYGQQVPRELSAYANQTTDDWHYSNLPYFDEAGEAKHFKAHCAMTKKGRLNTLLPLLQKSFIGARDRRDQAVILAMLIHFVGDAHQPLHAITRVTEGCEHDRGGNAFCAAPKDAKGKCTDNLHRLWDHGFGFFHNRDFEAILSAVAAQPVHLSGTIDNESMHPAAWQQENMAVADFVYDTAEGESPSQIYREKGTRIVRQRAHLAATRLAGILRELVRQNELRGAEAGRNE